jgi:hypothetical protein
VELPCCMVGIDEGIFTKEQLPQHFFHYPEWNPTLREVLI